MMKNSNTFNPDLPRLKPDHSGLPTARHLRLRRLSLALAITTGLTGCAHQASVPPQSQAELAAAQQCLAQQRAQNDALNQQQGQILAGLAQIQSQLASQQKSLESRPQVVERPAAKVNCPAPTQAAVGKASREQPASDKQIVGLREQAMIVGSNVVMNARINTNVANSVLDARNIQMFERNSEEWVRFTIYNPETKEPHVLERKRLRFQTVQSASATPERRPVVEIRFTIGKLTQKGEFILADRSTSEYPMLIGRNLLRDVMLVDVSGNNLAPLQRGEAASSAARASQAANKPAAKIDASKTNTSKN